MLGSKNGDGSAQERVQASGRAGGLQDPVGERIVLQGGLKGQSIIHAGHHRGGLAVAVLRDAHEIGCEALEENAGARAHHRLGIQQVREPEARHEVMRAPACRSPDCSAGEQLAADHFELVHGDLRDRVQRVVGLRGRLRRIRRHGIETGIGAVIAFRLPELEFMAQADIDRQLRRDSSNRPARTRQTSWRWPPRYRFG